ncbi:hypothetical protein M3Y96_00546700 [Aphelenchoides besseyi]|nr:hypothetical protein M3Y96_00546700 [Aphelenchoides besseyi]
MDLWSLMVVAAAFVLFHAVVSDHQQRIERDGRGLPVIGLLLNWLTPLLDEMADATSGRRLIAEDGGRLKSEPVSRPSKNNSGERMHTLQRTQDKKPTEEELRISAEMLAPLKKLDTATTSTAGLNVLSGMATAISTDSTATSDSAPSSTSTESPKKHLKRQHKKKSKRPTKTKSEEKGKRNAKKKSREHEKKDKKPRSKDKPQESSSSSNLSSNETVLLFSAEENDKLPCDSFEVDPNMPLKQKKATKEDKKHTDDETKESKRRSKREVALVPVSQKTLRNQKNRTSLRVRRVVQEVLQAN